MARPASRRGLLQQAPGGTITASGGCAAGLSPYESDGLAGVLWLGLPAAMAVATPARRRRQREALACTASCDRRVAS